MSDSLKKVLRKWLEEINISILVQVQGRLGHINYLHWPFPKPPLLEKILTGQLRNKEKYVV